MSGNGGDNAHNNAFSGGKNPGIGNSSSGSNTGTSGNGGNGGRTQNINGFSVDPNNSAQVNAANRGDAAGVFSAGGAIAITSGGDSHSGKGSGGNGGNSGSQSGSNNSQNQNGNSTTSAPSTWDRTAKYYGYNDKVSRKALKNLYEQAVRDGSIPKAARGNLRENVQKMLDEDNQIEALQKASEIIADMGEKVGSYLGQKYKDVSREIAGNVKNFQGKTIRNYNDAMASLNRIIANPGMKINQGDKTAIVNAWKSLNASDMANKLGNLSKAFKAADMVIKVEKIREKSIQGYETGNWGPLMLEVESWVISGIAVGVAMGIFGALASYVATTVGLPITALTIAGIIGISYLASLIDDKIVDKINNEIIRPAH